MPAARPSPCSRRRKAPPASPEAARDAAFWPLRMARELDDAILHLRANEPELGLLALRTEGDAAAVLAHDAFLETAQGRLVHPRGAPQPQARAQAPGRHLAQHGRADRARKLLRRHLGGTRLRRGPLGHVRRRARGRQPRAGRAHPLATEFRRLPDGERPDAAGGAVLRRARGRVARRGRGSARRWRRRRPRSSASSPTPTTRPTGTTRSASCWRSARASRPTR